MAFGNVYGYKTNVSTIVAFAEGDERTVTVDGDDVTVVDLVLTGQASGTARRYGVPVAASAEAAEVNQAFAVTAGDDNG